MIKWITKISRKDWIILLIGALITNVVVNSQAALPLFIFDVVVGALLGGVLLTAFKKYVPGL